jgi:hypothetical protein
MSERQIVNNHISSVIFIIFALVMIVFLFWDKIEPKKEEVLHNTTVLSVENLSKDTVLVYLTLNQSSGYINDVNGVFGIKSKNKKQGSFKLLPKETKTYTSPDGIALNGNIAFWDVPLNCPYVGATMFEFNLNNEQIKVNSQETVDISCVAGVNAYGEISIIQGVGGAWTDNIHSKPITNIKNKPLYKNTGISGVYPYGCTNCINTAGTPDCDGRPSYATPNTKHICNVQRNAKNSGGTVTIGYIGKP